MKKIMALISGLLILDSCAHHRDVRPGVDGLHKVSVRAEEKETAERSAISQAEHYCESINKHAAFVDEQKTQYTGSMDEGTRDTVRKASKAAMIVGGGAGVMGRQREVQTGGAVVGTAGTVGTVMTSGDDYLSEMKFKCQ